MCIYTNLYEISLTLYYRSYNSKIWHQFENVRSERLAYSVNSSHKYGISARDTETTYFPY